MKTLFLFFMILLGACNSFAQSNSFKLTDTTFILNSTYTSYPEDIFNTCNHKFNVKKIDSIKYLLLANPTMHIQIEWYTDQRGSTEYNKYVSTRYAAGMKYYITEDSIISANRISTIGYGESNLLYDNAAIAKLKTDQEKELAYYKNRRVVIRIIKL